MVTLFYTSPPVGGGDDVTSPLLSGRSSATDTTGIAGGAATAIELGDGSSIGLLSKASV